MFRQHFILGAIALAAIFNDTYAAIGKGSKTTSNSVGSDDKVK